MSESYTEGGAGPSLAAHSKDGSIRGQTPASEATGHPATPSNMARDSVSNAAASANRVVDQPGTRFAREAVKQPIDWISSCASSRCWPW